MSNKADATFKLVFTFSAIKVRATVKHFPNKT